MKRTLLAIVLGAGLSAPVACSCPSKESAGDRPGAVPKELRENVKKACEYQNAWPKRIYKVCNQCVSLSAAPACGCPADQRDYSGKCYEAYLAKKQEESCAEVYKCTHKCQSNQCDCLAKCYEGHETCQKLAANLEGCIAETCDSYCR